MKAGMLVLSSCTIALCSRFRRALIRKLFSCTAGWANCAKAPSACPRSGSINRRGLRPSKAIILHLILSHHRRLSPCSRRRQRQLLVRWPARPSCIAGGEQILSIRTRQPAMNSSLQSSSHPEHIAHTSELHRYIPARPQLDWLVACTNARRCALSVGRLAARVQRSLGLCQ